MKIIFSFSKSVQYCSNYLFTINCTYLEISLCSNKKSNDVRINPKFRNIIVSLKCRNQEKKIGKSR